MLFSREQQTYFSLCGLLFLVAASISYVAFQKKPVPHITQPGHNAFNLESEIDPNTAPWWELSTLPRIGVQSALSITTWRQDANRPAFITLQDLDLIHGIGPVTLRRISSHLRFSRTTNQNLRKVRNDQ